MLSIEDLEAHRVYLEGEAQRIAELVQAHEQAALEAHRKAMALDGQLGLIHTLLTQARAIAPKEQS